MFGQINHKLGQIGAAPLAKPLKRIDLDGLLAEKLIDWYADPVESHASQLRKACQLMTDFISNRLSSEIICASTPSGAVIQFKYALDDPSAWESVQKELSAMSPDDLENYHFPDLIHHLTLL